MERPLPELHAGERGRGPARPVEPAERHPAVGPGREHGLGGGYTDRKALGTHLESELDPVYPETIGNFAGYHYTNLPATGIIGARMPGMTVETWNKLWIGDRDDIPPHPHRDTDENPEITAHLVERAGWVLTTTEFPEVERTKVLAHEARENRPDLSTLSDAELVERARSMVPDIAYSYKWHVPATTLGAVAPSIIGAALATIDRVDALGELLRGAGQRRLGRPVVRDVGPRPGRGRLDDAHGPLRGAEPGDPLPAPVERRPGRRGLPQVPGRPALPVRLPGAQRVGPAVGLVGDEARARAAGDQRDGTRRRGDEPVHAQRAAPRAPRAAHGRARRADGRGDPGTVPRRGCRRRPLHAVAGARQDVVHPALERDARRPVRARPPHGGARCPDRPPRHHAAAQLRARRLRREPGAVQGEAGPAAHRLPRAVRPRAPVLPHRAAPALAVAEARGGDPRRPLATGESIQGTPGSPGRGPRRGAHRHRPVRPRRLRTRRRAGRAVDRPGMDTAVRACRRGGRERRGARSPTP